MEEQATPAELLRQAERIQERVVRRGPRDWVVQAAWAVWVLVFVPPFDVLPGAGWGPVVLISSAAGTIVTCRYYASRYRRVRPLGRARWGAWLVWSAWYTGSVVLAKVFGRHLGLAWTLAAVAAATPLLAYAGSAGRRKPLR